MKKQNGASHELKAQKISSQLKLPQDVTIGATILTVTGNYEITIENFKGILEYTEECIVIKNKKGMIRITGKKLLIHYFTNDSMMISGIMKQIEFL